MSNVLFPAASSRIWNMENLLRWPPFAFKAFRKAWQLLRSVSARCKQSAARNSTH